MPYRMKSVGFFIFGDCDIYKLEQACIYTGYEKKVSKGEYPLGSGFPIGASSIPVGTRFSVGKSSVLYLCFRLTPGRGWLRHLQSGQMTVDRRFPVAAGQTDFVQPWTKSGFAQREKSAWPEKEAKVYQNPRPAAATAPPLICVPLGFLTAFVDIILVLTPGTAKGCIGSAAQEHLLAVLAQA